MKNFRGKGVLLAIACICTLPLLTQPSRSFFARRSFTVGFRLAPRPAAFPWPPLLAAAQYHKAKGPGLPKQDMR